MGLCDTEVHPQVTLDHPPPCGVGCAPAGWPPTYSCQAVTAVSPVWGPCALGEVPTSAILRAGLGLHAVHYGASAPAGSLWQVTCPH